MPSIMVAAMLMSKWIIFSNLLGLVVVTTEYSCEIAYHICAL